MEVKYNKGQKIPIPRAMRPMLEKIISQREQLEHEAFREIGEAFGYGSKDIHKDQTWIFALTEDQEKAFCFERDDDTRTPINTVPIEQVMGGIMKLEAAKPANQIVVNCIELLVKDARYYTWRLIPAEMVIEIMGLKSTQEDLDLSSVANQGGVQ